MTILAAVEHYVSGDVSASTEHWLTIVVLLGTILGFAWRTWRKEIRPRLDKVAEELAWNRKQMEANGHAEALGRSGLTLRDSIDDNEELSKKRHAQNDVRLSALEAGQAATDKAIGAVNARLELGNARFAELNDLVAQAGARDVARTEAARTDDRPPRLDPEDES